MTIQRIHRNTLQQEDHSSRISACLIDFESDFTSEQAFLVPSNAVQLEHYHEGQNIFVETSQQAILHFQMLDAQQPHVFRLQLLPAGGACDYDVVGWIEMVMPISKQDYIFSVRVGDLRIDLDIDDTAGHVAHKGDWVQFTLIGLSLWDINM